jgi:hypothetical protein
LFVNSGDPAVASTLVNLITASYHGGLWDLPGITSSSAAGDSNGLTGVGYLASSSSFQAALTYYGDANLDGVINADDYVLFDRGLAKQLAGWVNGDFNYSGAVDTDDLLMIDRGFAFTHPGAISLDFLARREAEFGAGYVNSLLAAVPEPSSIAALAFGAAIFGSRRRRR